LPEVVDVVDIVDIVDAATIDGASVSADTCRGQPGVVDIVRVFPSNSHFGPEGR